MKVDGICVETLTELVEELIVQTEKQYDLRLTPRQQQVLITSIAEKLSRCSDKYSVVDDHDNLVEQVDVGIDSLSIQYRDKGR